MTSTTRRLFARCTPPMADRTAFRCRPRLVRLEDRWNPVNVANVLVSSGPDEFGALGQDTQSESSMIVFGDTVLTAFNDTGYFSEPSQNHKMGVSRSIDGGKSFVDFGEPGQPKSLPGNNDFFDPTLARDAATSGPYAGRVYLGNITNPKTTMNIFRSLDGGATWQPPVSVSGKGPSPSIDKPWIAVDNALANGFGKNGQGNLYVVGVDRTIAVGGEPGIFFTRSVDGGDTFGNNQLLAPGPATGGNQVQGANVVVGIDHTVYVFWLAQSGVEGEPRRIEMRRGSYDPNTTDVTFDSAQTVVKLANPTVLPPSGNLGLEFGTNSFPQAAVNPGSGELYLVYNDVVSGDRSNVYLIRSSNKGETWTAPVKVNDDGGTNDQFFPTVAVTPDGTTLVVAFYDRRHDAANKLIDYYAAEADIDSGAGTVSFRPNQRISTESFPAVFGAQDPVIPDPTYMGDYDVAAADNAAFYFAWGDNRRLNLAGTRNQADIRFAKMSVNAKGPEAVSVTPRPGEFTPAGVVNVVFNQAMDTTSFSVGPGGTVGGDVLSFTRDGAPIASPNLGFTWVSNRHLRITYAPQTLAGRYEMRLGPDIKSAAGLPVDDDLDGSPLGPTAGDEIVVTFDQLVVTTTADTGPGSLRQAVLDANGKSDPHTIIFDPVVFGSAQTITLSGELKLTKPMAVTAPAAGLTLQAGGAGRHFHIDIPGRHEPVYLTGMTLTGGGGVAYGGSVYLTDDYLTLTNCTLAGNKATTAGGAVSVFNPFGGTQTTNRGAGIVSVVRSTISGNTAPSGGGLYLGLASTLLMNESTIHDNNATDGNGGGIAAVNDDGIGFDPRATIRYSTISANTAVRLGSAAFGGGLYLRRTTGDPQGAILINSTVSGNTAGNPLNPENDVGKGGGLFIDLGWEGALTTPVFSIAIFNSTVTANTAFQADGRGGRNIAITQFKPGTNGDRLTLDSTIVASDSAPASSPDIADVTNPGQVFGNVTAFRSFIGVSDGGSIALAADPATNRIGTQSNPLAPQLDPLAFYGGPTKTHRLHSTSKALNFGQNTLALPYDQRGVGFFREVGKRADIGAYEREESKGPGGGGGDAAMVSVISVNDGLTGALAGVQRSRVMNVAVHFNREVWFDPVEPVASAFRLFRLSDGAEPGLVAAVGTAPGGGTVVTLSFTSSVAAENGSLADGVYALSISCGMVDGGNFDGDGDGLPGGDFVLVGSPSDGPRLFRLFGDYDGNGTVDWSDFGVFRDLHGNATDPAFAFDGSGWEGNADFAAFRARFGMSVDAAGGVIPML